MSAGCDEEQHDQLVWNLSLAQNNGPFVQLA